MIFPRSRTARSFVGNVIGMAVLRPRSSVKNRVERAVPSVKHKAAGT